MSVSKALARSARTWLDLSAARFGQARAITNARHEATRMSRQRVEREDVRLFLDGLGGADRVRGRRRGAPAARPGLTSHYPGLP